MTRTNGRNRLANADNDPVILSLDDVVVPPDQDAMTIEEPSRQMIDAAKRRQLPAPPPPRQEVSERYLQHVKNVIEGASQAANSELREIAQILEQCGGEFEISRAWIIED